MRYSDTLNITLMIKMPYVLQISKHWNNLAHAYRVSPVLKASISPKQDTHCLRPAN